MLLRSSLPPWCALILLGGLGSHGSLQGEAEDKANLMSALHAAWMPSDSSGDKDLGLSDMIDQSGLQAEFMA